MFSSSVVASSLCFRKIILLSIRREQVEEEKRERGVQRKEFGGSCHPPREGMVSWTRAKQCGEWKEKWLKMNLASKINTNCWLFAFWEGKRRESKLALNLELTGKWWFLWLCGRGREGGQLCSYRGPKGHVTTTLGESLVCLLTKQNLLLPYNPDITLIGICPNELKAHVHTKTCTGMCRHNCWNLEATRMTSSRWMDK